ncbi:DUF6286 domain-containing protein [Streptomyces sp. ISL-86]|uniref:DUF6286 domain-containing protein n=1 Tax=Streptomyces sp. ISL-86 TaxID=2819187 RepID=UPI002035A643|nr:DUF6286 domain-containing protein [Streptomyces sp. ISL-86]
MTRDQDPAAEREQPTATDKAASRMTGLLAKQPSDTPQRGYGNDAGGGLRPSRRPWSARRIPAALIALVIGAAAAILLFDVVRVRAGNVAAAWRTRLADELATRPMDDIWIQVGAAVLTVVGLWLIILALTPGLRHQLPLKSPDDQVQALLDRDAAALLLRDAAMRVPGVSGARIRVGRNRITARAEVRFRAPDDVRADLLTALLEQRDRLALARPPRLAIRVRPARK